jgi:ligand-binding SRPBCC domain-containing protein
MTAMSTRTFVRTSAVAAPVDDVWRRVTDFAGVNHELAPLMRMRVPPALRGATVATAPVGVPLGKAWILYLGFLPLEYDDMTLVEVEPGSHFHEVSTMAAMRRWEHRRELRAVDGGRTETEVRDIVTFRPRLRWMAGVLEPAVRQLFAHRHRRLVRYFADG